MIDGKFKLQELADAAGVTPRTVRYYIAQGLLPSPGRLGANTRYGREHLDRLGLIRRLQDQGLPLAEIRNHVDENEALISAPMLMEASARPFAPMQRRVEDHVPAPDLPYAGAGRTTWERILLTPDLELHVQRPQDAETRRLVDAIVALAAGRA